MKTTNQVTMTIATITEEPISNLHHRSNNHLLINPQSNNSNNRTDQLALFSQVMMMKTKMSTISTLILNLYLVSLEIAMLWHRQLLVTTLKETHKLSSVSYSKMMMRTKTTD